MKLDLVRWSEIYQIEELNVYPGKVKDCEVMGVVLIYSIYDLIIVLNPTWTHSLIKMQFSQVFL